MWMTCVKIEEKVDRICFQEQKKQQCVDYKETNQKGKCVDKKKNGGNIFLSHTISLIDFSNSKRTFRS